MSFTSLLRHRAIGLDGSGVQKWKPNHSFQKSLCCFVFSVALRMEMAHVSIFHFATIDVWKESNGVAGKWGVGGG